VLIKSQRQEGKAIVAGAAEWWGEEVDALMNPVVEGYIRRPSWIVMVGGAWRVGCIALTVTYLGPVSARGDLVSMR
jgi:hypothetical protein